MFEILNINRPPLQMSVMAVYFYGANEVVIYNFLALLTIDTNINQFIKVYHIFYKLQE